MRWPRSGCFDRYWQRWKDTLKQEVMLAMRKGNIEV